MSKKRKLIRETISGTAIGSIDSGKTTLTGRLVHESGLIDSRLMEKLEKLGEERGRSSYKYIHLVDTLTRSRGRKEYFKPVRSFDFDTENRTVVIRDIFGRDSVRDTIKSLLSSDFAILVVDSGPNFEQNVKKQIHQLVQIVQFLGIEQMLVCVNKMDEECTYRSMKKFDEARFDFIREKLLELLVDNIGFKDDEQHLNFIPICAFEGDNIKSVSPNMPWWKEGKTRTGGMSLFDILNNPNFIIPKPDLSHLPLRLPVQDVYKIGGIGTVPVGKVECGTLVKGNVVFSPPVKLCEVRSIERFHCPVDEVRSGQVCGYHVPKISVRSLRRGFVMGELNRDPPMISNMFEAEILILYHPGLIKVGYCPVIDVHTAHIACVFETFVSKKSKKTGEVVESPKTLENGDIAIIRLRPTKPLVIERFEEYPPLGTFSIRDMRRVVGVGVVKNVMKKRDGKISKIKERRDRKYCIERIMDMWDNVRNEEMFERKSVISVSVSVGNNETFQEGSHFFVFKSFCWNCKTPQ